VEMTDVSWDGSWEAHADAQLELWLLATPAQRLEWLEDALCFARDAGALGVGKAAALNRQDQQPQ
jgi:hypothetical protein